MIRPITISISILLVILIALFVFSGINIHKGAGQIDAQITVLQARKDELLLQQQRVELVISQLNDTIEKLNGYQQNFIDRIATLSGEQAALLNQQAAVLQQKETANTPPPAPEPIVLPTVTSRPRVTRAS